MRIATIDIPKGCTQVCVDLETDGKVIVSYASSSNSKEFLCEETGEMEEIPGIGDFAICWDMTDRQYAVAINVGGKNEDGLFIGSDGLRYGRAIKFRNYEQYLKVKGIYGE